MIKQNYLKIFFYPAESFSFTPIEWASYFFYNYNCIFLHVDFKGVHWGQNFRFFSLRLEQGYMRMDLCLGILQIFWSCTAELSAAYSCWPFWLGKWRISLPPLQVSVQYCDPHYSFATSSNKQVCFNLCFG